MRASLSTESKPLTWLRKQCSRACFDGCSDASQSGLKMFSIYCPKDVTFCMARDMA